MSKAIPGGDTLPWYRQFWPWFLILLPASVVVAAISTVVIANRHADDLVVDDYYKDGLAINRQLEKIERAKGLGITATLGIQDTHLTVILQGAPELEEVTLMLSHPLEADQDIELTLKRIAPATYYTALPAAIDGRWHWRLEGAGQASAEDGWRVDGVLEPGDIHAGAN